MTSGDEPQLGAQAHDNAPMIGGRGSKIILSARGAYEARNLQALVGMLDEGHELRFRQVLWNEAADVIRAVMRIRKLDHPGMHPAVMTLEYLLANPSSEQAKREIREFFFEYRDIDVDALRLTGLRGDYDDSDQWVRHCLSPMVYHLLEFDQFSLIELLEGVPHSHTDEAGVRYSFEVHGLFAVSWGARRGVPHAGSALRYWWIVDKGAQSKLREWYIEVAWALLSNQPIPTLGS